LVLCENSRNYRMSSGVSSITLNVLMQ